MMKKSLALKTLMFGLTAVLVSGCNRTSSDEEDSGPPPTPLVPVKIASVIRGQAVVTVAATGRIDALRREKVFSPVAGRILSLKALEGTAFHEGDVMAVVRPREAQSAIAGAEALLRSARSPEQTQEARRALDLANSVQSAVDLRAKFNGVVATRAVTEGELVAENAELFSLVDLSTFVFQADVPVAALPGIHPGQQAEVQCTGLPSWTFRGNVDAISPQSDPQSQTVRVRIRFHDPGSHSQSLLKVDMPGTARIVTGTHPHALLIPRPALLRNDENNTYSVVTVTADSLARSVPVTVGVLTDSTAEITGGGLQPGMQVVTEGNYALADSTKVNPAGQGAP